MEAEELPEHIGEPIKIVRKEITKKYREYHEGELKKMKKNETRYISPNELAERWQCSRSSVDRIARRAEFTRLCLGEGKNGTIRYIRGEVEAYEQARQVKLTA